MSAMLPQENSAPQDDDPLSSRPDSSLWLALGIWGFGGIALAIAIPFSPAPHTSDFWSSMLSILGIGFVLPVVAGCWAMLRCKIQADKSGLTFVGLFHKRFVPWEEITDFWYRTPTRLYDPAQNKGFFAYIEVRGRKRPFSLGVTATPELLARIEREVRWAKVRRFEFKDTRVTSEWPKNFAYKAMSRGLIVRALLLWVCAVNGYFVIDTLSKLGWPRVTVGINSLSFSAFFWDKLAYLLFLNLMFVLQGIPIFAGMLTMSTPKQWLSQSIQVTLQGLSFRQGDAEDFVLFDEIECYYLEARPGNFQPALYVIETRRHHFEFLSSLTNSSTLRLIIQQRAINSTTKKWSYLSGHDEDTLGDARNLWGGGAIGVGPKLYHYRTRTNRALLFLGVFVSLASLVRPIFGIVRGGVWIAPQTADVVMACVVIAPILLGVVLGLCGWFFSAIETDEEGLRHRGIWGERFLKWSELESYSFNGHFYTLRGQRQSVRFGLLADSNSLLAEIERRAPQAKGSWRVNSHEK